MTVTDYKAYRPALRDEFNYACGYCKNREPELGGSEAFHVDHYRPKSKFPHLISKYTNLIYSCRYCNRSKGNYWPRFLEWILDRIILNPRTDNFENHIDQSVLPWVGLTSKGRWTVLKLKLDSSGFCRRRKRRQSLESGIIRLEGVLAQLQVGLNNAVQQNTEEAVIRELHHDIAELINEINAIRQVIEGRAD